MKTLPLFLCIAVTLGAGVGCAQSPAPADGAYVASNGGQVYFRTDCEDWRSIEAGDRVWFESASEAEAAGYTAAAPGACAGSASEAGRGPAETGTCTIERVVDGDTVVCREAAERIRLLLVDSPEMEQGEFGAQAKEMLESLLHPGDVATVELDVEARDQYGRLLAYLYKSDGEMVNEALARSGYAVAIVYPPNVRHIDTIRAAVDDAQRGGRGLWSTSGFDCRPRDYRADRCE